MADNQTSAHEKQKEKLEKQKKELRKKIGEQDGRLNHLQSTGFQLANFYFVFQGVILTATVNGASGTLRCSDNGFLLTLSILAAILNFVSLLIIGNGYIKTITQRDRSLHQCNKLLNDLTLLDELPAASDQHEEAQEEMYEVDRYRKLKRTLLFAVCMVLFLGVSGIMFATCYTILCRNSAVSNKCMTFCDGSKCMRICSEY